MKYTRKTKKTKKTFQAILSYTAAVMLAVPGTCGDAVWASSHMDAPQITYDDPANTTDVYAFVTVRDGVKYLTTALAVYPHEEPGIGPNKYTFDDNVRYEIHVATRDDISRGQATFSYQFDFTTNFKNQDTILQSYLGVIQDVDDDSQNLTQTYTVRKLDRRPLANLSPGTNLTTLLSMGIVPPNNQGIATNCYQGLVTY